MHFFAFFCTCFHCPVRVVFALLMSVTQPEAGAQVHTNDEEEENSIRIYRYGAPESKGVLRTTLERIV